MPCLRVLILRERSSNPFPPGTTKEIVFDLKFCASLNVISVSPVLGFSVTFRLGYYKPTYNIGKQKYREVMQ